MADLLAKTIVSSSAYSYPLCGNHHKNQMLKKQISLVSVVSQCCESKDFPSRVKTIQASLGSQRVSFGSGLYGKRVVLQEDQRRPRRGLLLLSSIKAKNGFGLGRNAPRWWEKGQQSNMKKVTSAQDLVDSLVNAGDKLVVVGFFSPGCGGCRALHPKICQLAGTNPKVLFLQVNNAEHHSMCYALNVHVLPLFRFYRGAHGRLCNFSCTIATIKKLKEALAKHATAIVRLGPTKGLEEKELIALASNKDLNFTYKPKEVHFVPSPAMELMVPTIAHPNSIPALPLPLPLPLPTISRPAEDTEEKTLVTSGR